MKNVFLVEDEALIRMMIAEMVEELGHRVAAEAGNVDEATSLARTGNFDFAVLDVNLAGRSVSPVAEILESRRVPFIFASGYGATGLPQPFTERRVLRKPFLVGQLREEIAIAVSSKEGR